MINTGCHYIHRGCETFVWISRTHLESLSRGCPQGILTSESVHCARWEPPQHCRCTKVLKKAHPVEILCFHKQKTQGSLFASVFTFGMSIKRSAITEQDIKDIHMAKHNRISRVSCRMVAPMNVKGSLSRLCQRWISHLVIYHVASSKQPVLFS